jgi:hypothetical protein
MMRKLEMHHQTLLIAFALLASLPGCKSLSDDPTGSPEGNWATDCINAGDGTSYSEAFTATGATYARSTKLYLGDVVCTALSYTVTVNGIYLTTRTVAPSIEKYRRIDLVTSKVMATPASASEATQMNTDHECGLSTWSSGVAQDIAGRLCVSTRYPLVGQTDYNIFELLTHKLTFGDESGSTDGKYTENRPYALDTSRVFLKLP